MTNRLVHIPEDVSSLVAQLLVESGCVRVESTKLTTGREAPYYVSLRDLAALPQYHIPICTELRRVVAQLGAQALMGIPDASNLLAMTTAMVGEEEEPRLPVLRMAKTPTRDGQDLYGGTHIAQGSSIVVIDDVITDGGSKIKPVQKLQSCGYSVEAIVVVVDRCEGGVTLLKDRYGVQVFALCSVYHLMTELERQGKATAAQLEEITSYLRQANA